VADPGAPFGWRYATTARLVADAHVVPLAAPTVRLRVGDFLP
jgi:hypothetical protein